MAFPEVYLAIDNCFASKRWTKPDEWCGLIRSLGVRFIEASADTELDPFFVGRESLREWAEEVRKAEARHDVRVANLYSGHGTYTFLGIANPEERIRARMIDEWFRPLIDTAARLGAGMGFLTHAFPDRALSDRDAYGEFLEILYDSLARINRLGAQAGCGSLGIEQMYSPHIVPWTITGARQLLKQVILRSGRDFYLTEDVGHHTRRFLKPSLEQIVDAVLAFQDRGRITGVWLGSERVYSLVEREASARSRPAAEIAEAALDMMSETPFLFSEAQDADYCQWLQELGGCCPIVHLQQTDGESSPHWHFTESNNARGIIRPARLLAALRKGCEKAHEQGMPTQPRKVYLTLEAFTATASYNHDTIEDYRESVRFWRRYIVEDGIPLDQIPLDGDC